MLIKLTSHEETFKTEGIATFLLFSEFSLSKSELIFFLFFIVNGSDEKMDEKLCYLIRRK